MPFLFIFFQVTFQETPGLLTVMCRCQISRPTDEVEPRIKMHPLNPLLILAGRSPTWLLEVLFSWPGQWSNTIWMWFWTPYSVSFFSRWHCSAWKRPWLCALPGLSAVSPRLTLKQCQCLVEHWSFMTLEGGMSATSFLHSYFLQAVNAVMLWPVHVQQISQAS